MSIKPIRAALACALIFASCDAAEYAGQRETPDRDAAGRVPGRDTCQEPVRTADLPVMLDETSGIALSRRDDSIIWAHNDSEGTATLYALARDGSLRAELPIPAAGRQFDWEDIAAGPCPMGDCLYIADIGDNLHVRDDRAILRLAEPSINAPLAPAVERFPVQYPDGPVDAEALFVMPDTTIYIVTKGRRGAAALFRYPPPLRPGERMMLEQVQQLSDGVAQLPDLVTAADATPAGERIAIRTYSAVTLYRFDGDTLVPVSRTGLEALAEPQGEALAFAGADTLLLATEAGPGGAQPFLSILACPGGSVRNRAVAARMVHPYALAQVIEGQGIAP